MISNKNIDKVIELVKRQVEKTVPYVTLLSLRERDPFKILVSTILSARTKDEVTKNASERLFKIVRNPKDILRMKENELQRTIYPVGFYRQKTRYLKELAKSLIEKYNGKVPNSLEELMELPGVGRKTANLVITLAFDKFGICVDTHVHRIANRWGYVKTKNPKETEFELRKKLPKKYWKEINTLLVSFGQTVCKPISPICSTCFLNQFCPKIGVKRWR